MKQLGLFALLGILALSGFSCQIIPQPPDGGNADTMPPAETAPDRLPVTALNGAEGDYLVALGDGFTLGYNLSAEDQGANEKHSFATGANLKSVYQYLKEKEPELLVINLAQPLASTLDLARVQLPLVGQYHARYITIFTGIIDLHQEAKPEELESALKGVILKLRADYPQATIIIATLPNLSLQVNRNDFSCQGQNNILNINWGAFTAERIQGMNARIKKVALEYQAVVVDLYPTLGVQDYSEYDCLHPNIAGQEKIARAFVRALR